MQTYKGPFLLYTGRYKDIKQSILDPASIKVDGLYADMPKAFSQWKALSQKHVDDALFACFMIDLLQAEPVRMA